MADETFVQIEIPRTGQKIRNLSTPVQQPDGTVSTVLMQVVALAQADGQMLTPTPSAWDNREDTAWDGYQAGPMNFPTINVLTRTSAWES
jgi:hypothetical protein